MMQNKINHLTRHVPQFNSTNCALSVFSCLLIGITPLTSGKLCQLLGVATFAVRYKGVCIISEKCYGDAREQLGFLTKNLSVA